MNRRKTPYWQKYTDEGYRNPEYDEFLKKVKFAALFVLLLLLISALFYQKIITIL